MQVLFRDQLGFCSYWFLMREENQRTWRKTLGAGKNQQCVVPENIHPMEGYWKFQGGEGVQKPNFLNESMTLKWNFWRGGEFNLKTFHGRGMDIFWNNTIFQRVVACFVVAFERNLNVTAVVMALPVFLT